MGRSATTHRQAVSSFHEVVDSQISLSLLQCFRINLSCDDVARVSNDKILCAWIAVHRVVKLHRQKGPFTSEQLAIFSSSSELFHSSVPLRKSLNFSCITDVRLAAEVLRRVARWKQLTRSCMVDWVGVIQSPVVWPQFLGIQESTSGSALFLSIDNQRQILISEVLRCVEDGPGGLPPFLRGLKNRACKMGATSNTLSDFAVHNEPPGDLLQILPGFSDFPCTLRQVALDEVLDASSLAREVDEAVMEHCRFVCVMGMHDDLLVAIAHRRSPDVQSLSSGHKLQTLGATSPSHHKVCILHAACSSSFMLCGALFL